MKLKFLEKYFELGKKFKKSVRYINVVNMYSKIHQDRKSKKVLQLGLKKLSGKEGTEEGEDTTPF